MNKFLKNNSSTILTVIGSVGVGITAIMSARDTVKAIRRISCAENIQKIEYLEDHPLTKKQKLKIAAPCYIPTIISGVSTILCICGANKINKNLQKSLASAYVLLDRSYKEYRDSVKEVHGEDGELEVVKNISDKKAKELDMVEQTEGDMFFDFFSLQFFRAKMTSILEAEKAANEILKTQGYISLRTMYSLIGENVIGTDDLLGWSIAAGKEYGYDNIEIEVHQMTREDGTTYYVLDFVNGPTEDYLYL